MQKGYVQKSNSKGFTIIELLTVITIMAVLSTIGIASFVTYSRQQELNNAAHDVVTILQQAKAATSSQILPTDCSNFGIFEGYSVIVTPPSSYLFEAVCGGVLVGSSKISKTLPDHIIFSTAATTIMFHAGSGTGNAAETTVTIHHSDAGSNKNITVYPDGRIHVQ